VLEHYRAMLAFRKRHPALSKGSITLLDAPDGILAYTRQDDEEALLCVFNMSEAPAVFTVPMGMVPRGIDAPGTLPDPENGTLEMPPFSAYLAAIGADGDFLPRI
ncbi:MAG TPA: alpha-glucosidase C-terminal domain-containing protein, partial [Devosiaceae bacterium]|nr:alpha-glucosidase C-terminal domain-containing protein [Devosiaceae bacterium]